MRYSTAIASILILLAMLSSPCFGYDLCPRYPRYVCGEVSAFVVYAQSIQHHEPFEERERLLNDSFARFERAMMAYEHMCSNDYMELWFKVRSIFASSRTLHEKVLRWPGSEDLATQTRVFADLADQLMNLCDKTGGDRVPFYHPVWVPLKKDSIGCGPYGLASYLKSLREEDPKKYRTAVAKYNVHGDTVELAAGTEVLPTGRRDGSFAEVIIESNKRCLLIPLKDLTASGVAMPSMVYYDLTVFPSVPVTK